MTPPNAPTRVVLADDHEMVRHALARVLEDSGKVQIVAQAGSAGEALAAVEAERPEVAVLDYSMPDQDAPGLIERLLGVQPDLKILVLTVHDNIHYAIRVLESGAHGFIIKASAVDELVDGIEAVRRGQIYVSSSMSHEVMNHLRRPRRDRVGLDALSPREFDFLRWIAAGKTLQEASVEMGIGTSTASTYRTRVMEKLKVSSTAELIRFAIEHGVV